MLEPFKEFFLHRGCRCIPGLTEPSNRDSNKYILAMGIS